MRATRGDLVVVEYRKEYGSGPTYEVERVVGVNRDGDVMRTVRYSFGHENQPEEFYRTSTSRGHKIRRFRCYSNGACWMVPAAAVDVEAAWSALTERTDTERYWAPTEFDSLEAARDFLKAYRLEAAS